MEKQSRRKFITTAVALTTSAAVASALPISSMETKEKKQLAHHVFFWLKNRDSKEDLQKLIKGLETLRKIETVRKLHIGVPAAVEQRPVVQAGYSVSELILFDDLEGHNTYQVHPIHKKFIDDHKDLWEKVVVYDSMDV